LYIRNNSVAIKNGNKEGTTELDHSNNPDFAAARFCFENITKHNIKRQIIVGRIAFFNFIMINLFLSISSPYIIYIYDYNIYY
jgi:hypothetical protein